MLTQPPYKYAVGAGAGQLIGDEPPYADWTHFCARADAEVMLARVQALGATAELVDYTHADGGYIQFGPNNLKIAVWIISGSIPGPRGENLPILDYAGELIDAEFNPPDGSGPRDGVDAYPRPPKVQLWYSPSEQGLTWKAA